MQTLGPAWVRRMRKVWVVDLSVGSESKMIITDGGEDV